MNIIQSKMTAVSTSGTNVIFIQTFLSQCSKVKSMLCTMSTVYGLATVYGRSSKCPFQLGGHSSFLCM